MNSFCTVERLEFILMLPIIIIVLKVCATVERINNNLHVILTYSFNVCTYKL